MRLKSKDKENELIEKLAELEHQQWMSWADSILKTEKISSGRINRWEKLFVDYRYLTEESKEQDREWARKVLKIIKETK